MAGAFMGSLWNWVGKDKEERAGYIIINYFKNVIDNLNLLSLCKHKEIGAHAG